MDQQESTKPKRNYGWVILGLSFGNLIVEGGVTRSQPVFLPALRQGFGGSAAMTAAIFSAAGVFGGLVANELVSIQPMSLPSGLLFYLDYTYGQDVGGVA